MRSLNALVIGGVFSVVLLTLPGCLNFGRGGTTDKEVAEMAKLYRQCLQKNEENPEKAKANCGLYKEAMQDLAPAQKKSIIADVLGLARFPF